MQEFPNFQNLQFVKNTTFSKFSQNLSFFKRLTSKEKVATNYIKNRKKKMAGIGESMVPTFDGLTNIDPMALSSKPKE
jgi:hypothetical protein